MKLLKVQRQGESYYIEALKSIKIWKYKLGIKKIRFHCHDDLNGWKYSCKDKKVSLHEERLLRRWIQDHRRFVEEMRPL